MKNVNVKMQRNLIVVSLIAIILVLGTFLVSNFKVKGQKDEAIISDTKKPQVNVVPENSKPVKNIVKQEAKVKTKDTQNASNKVVVNKNKKNIVINFNKSSNHDRLSKSKPPKTKPKTRDKLTNKNKVPSYDDKDVKLQTDNNSSKKIKGKIYVPGFGWIKNEGGGGKGVKVDSDGDINKQVGIMN